MSAGPQSKLTFLLADDRLADAECAGPDRDDYRPIFRCRCGRDPRRVIHLNGAFFSGLPNDLDHFAALVRSRGLCETEKLEGKDKIAGRIRLLHEVVQQGLKELCRPR